MARRSYRGKSRSRSSGRRGRRNYSTGKSRRGSVRGNRRSGPAVHIVVHQAGPQNQGPSADVTSDMLKAKFVRPRKAQF